MTSCYSFHSFGKYYEDPDVKGIRVNISMASGHPTLCDRCAEVVG